MILWLSGPTGSGKSSLAALLAGIGYGVVRERLPEDLFHAFVSDPTRHCAALQESIMQSRGDQWMALSDHRRVAFDRSVDEDVAVFCRLHHKRGLLGPDQLASLAAMANKLRGDLPAPDLIVYLCPRARILRERLMREGHPPLIVEALDRQVALYEEWVVTRQESVLRIDNGACDPNTLKRLFGA